KLPVLLRRRRVLDRLLSQHLKLLPQRLVLRLRVEEARNPVVAVLERPGNGFRTELEGPKHAGRNALDAGKRAVVGLPEIPRDEDERQRYEYAGDNPSAERV